MYQLNIISKVYVILIDLDKIYLMLFENWFNEIMVMIDEFEIKNW